MQKKILSSLIGGLLLASNSAMAVVDLTDSTTIQTFLPSVSGGSGGTVGDITGGLGCDAVIQFPVGFSISAGSSRFLKLTLTNATFAAAFDTTAPSVFDSAGGLAAAGGTVSIATGGAAGDSEVVLELTAGAAISNVDTFGVNFDITGLNTTGDVGLSTALYAGVASLGTDTPIAGTPVSGTAFAFGDGVTFTATAVASEEINTQNDVAFVSAATFSPLADLAATLSACSALGVVATAGVVSKLTVTSTGGGFDAFTGGGADVDLGTTAAGCASDYLANTISVANNEAVFNDTVTGYVATNPTSPDLITPTSGQRLCVAPDTTTSMVAAGYMCTLEVSGTGFSAPVTIGPIACGEIQFAGSSDRVAWGQAPDSTYKQFFRISNPSTTEGNVTVTLTNDAGDSVSFPLSDVATSPLAAGASTGLLSNKVLYDAAVAVDASFVVATGAKLRVVVRGDFGDDMNGSTAGQSFGDANSQDGIILEAVAVGLNGEIVIME